MKNPPLSVTVHGIYLLATGAPFVLAPNLVLPLFGFPTTTEVWVRIVGLLSAILGMYFLYCARPDQRRFMQATVYARLILGAGAIIFALLGLGLPVLIVFAVIDWVGAAWTGWALRAAR